MRFTLSIAKLLTQLIKAVSLLPIFIHLFLRFFILLDSQIIVQAFSILSLLILTHLLITRYVQTSLIYHEGAL